MNDRIEQLLEELVAQNDRVASTLESMLTELEQIHEELNWVGEHSFAQMVVDGLHNLQVAAIR